MGPKHGTDSRATNAPRGAHLSWILQGRQLAMHILSIVRTDSQN